MMIKLNRLAFLEKKINNEQPFRFVYYRIPSNKRQASNNH